MSQRARWYRSHLSPDRFSFCLCSTSQVLWAYVLLQTWELQSSIGFSRETKERVFEGSCKQRAKCVSFLDNHDGRPWCDNETFENSTEDSAHVSYHIFTDSFFFFFKERCIKVKHLLEVLFKNNSCCFVHHIIWTPKCCCFLSLCQASGLRPTHTTSQSAATQTQHKSGATCFSPNHDWSHIIELHHIFSMTLLTIPGDVWFFFTPPPPPPSLCTSNYACVCVCLGNRREVQQRPAETNTHTHTRAHTQCIGIPHAVWNRATGVSHRRKCWGLTPVSAVELPSSLRKAPEKRKTQTAKIRIQLGRSVAELKRPQAGQEQTEVEEV